LAQASATLLPTGETMPKPVTTTLRRDKVISSDDGECSAKDFADYFLRFLLM
jgi:hypothetical protein